MLHNDCQGSSFVKTEAYKSVNLPYPYVSPKENEGLGKNFSLKSYFWYLIKKDCL